MVNCHLQSIGLTPDDKELYRELTDKDTRPTKSELTKVKNDLIGYGLYGNKSDWYYMLL